MSKVDLTIEPPLLNAAGTLGFAPDPHGVFDISRLGAFVTNPLSLAKRHPAGTASCLHFPGGFLLHSGYPNPGLKHAIRQYGNAWSRATLPVIVAVIPGSVAEVSTFINLLEGLPGVVAVEIGLPHDATPEDLLALAQAAFGELAVILRLPLDQAERLVAGHTDELLEAGVDSICLGPPRGALPGVDGRMVFGRLYGPALFPQALAVTQRLVGEGLAVISAGGVYSARQAQTLLTAGASAVQLDGILWRDPTFATWDA